MVSFGRASPNWTVFSISPARTAIVQSQLSLTLVTLRTWVRILWVAYPLASNRHSSLLHADNFAARCALSC